VIRYVTPWGLTTRPVQSSTIRERNDTHRMEDDGDRADIHNDIRARHCGERSPEISQTRGAASNATVLRRCQNLQDNKQMV
jgi:hypothetical protein